MERGKENASHTHPLSPPLLPPLNGREDRLCDEGKQATVKETFSSVITAKLFKTPLERVLDKWSNHHRWVSYIYISFFPLLFPSPLTLCGNQGATPTSLAIDARKMRKPGRFTPSTSDSYGERTSIRSSRGGLSLTLSLSHISTSRLISLLLSLSCLLLPFKAGTSLPARQDPTRAR